MTTDGAKSAEMRSNSGVEREREQALIQRFAVYLIYRRNKAVIVRV